FLTMTRPRRSTVFPYTTLFRSSGYIDVLKALAAQGYMVGAVFHADARYSKVRIEDLADLAFALAFFPTVVEMQALRPLALKAMTDRKSTRLNSSHDQSSYAVFC